MWTHRAYSQIASSLSLGGVLEPVPNGLLKIAGSPMTQSCRIADGLG